MRKYEIEAVKKSVNKRIQTLPQTTDTKIETYLQALQGDNLSDAAYDNAFPDLFQNLKKEERHTNPFWQPAMKRAAYTFSTLAVQAKAATNKKQKHKEELVGQDRGKYVKLYSEGITLCSQLDAWSRRSFALLLLSQFENYDWPSGLVSMAYPEMVRQMESSILRFNTLKQMTELKKYGALYSSEIMDFITFSVNFFPHNTFKRGLECLNKASLYSDKNEKLFFATKNKGMYYLNPKPFYRGNRSRYLKKLEDGEQWKNALIESWDDPDVTVEEYLRICDEVCFIPNISRAELAEISEKNNEEEKETERYIKIYREGIVPVCLLNRTAREVLIEAFSQLLKAPENTEMVRLSFVDNTFPKEGKQYNYYYQGLRACMRNGLFCKTDKPEWFYINPCFFFSGDRENL